MSNSDNSDHSLRSKGLVDPATSEASRRVNQQKAAAKWTAEEKRALVTYLQQHAAGTGDGINFLKIMFAGASQQLKKDFPHQKGGEKTASTCHFKWTRLKEEYHTVMHLKTSTGASWSNETGAGKAKMDPEWISIIEHNKIAGRFRCKGFPLFKLMDKMMPVKSKGKYIFRAGKKARSSATKISSPSMSLNHAVDSSMPPPDSTSRASMPPPPQTFTPAPLPFLVEQASSDVSTPPSVPSSFLLPSEHASTSSDLMSVSRGKHKVDGSEAADPPAQSQKRSCGSSTVEAIKQVFSDTMGSVMKALATPVVIKDACEDAVKILNDYVDEYSVDDFLDLSMHLTQNRAKAILFVGSPAMHRKAFLDKSLIAITAAKEQS